MRNAPRSPSRKTWASLANVTKPRTWTRCGASAGVRCSSGPVLGAKLSNGSGCAGVVTVIASRTGHEQVQGPRLRFGLDQPGEDAGDAHLRVHERLRQRLLPVAGHRHVEGRAVEGDELGDEVAGRVGVDVLDDAGDVQPVGVVEMLQRAAGEERPGQRKAVGAEPGDAPRDHERQRIAGVGDAVDLQALADAEVGGGVEADEDAAGRVLGVDGPPDRIGEGDGRGDGDGVVQRHPIGPQGADRPDGLEELDGVGRPAACPAARPWRSRRAATGRRPGRASSVDEGLETR